MSTFMLPHHLSPHNNDGSLPLPCSQQYIVSGVPEYDQTSSDRRKKHANIQQEFLQKLLKLEIQMPVHVIFTKPRLDLSDQAVEEYRRNNLIIVPVQSTIGLNWMVLNLINRHLLIVMLHQMMVNDGL